MNSNMTTSGVATQNKSTETCRLPHFPQPNRCARVVLLGLAAWLIGILGFIALGTGLDDLHKIKQGKMRSEGKGFIIFGMISGVVGFLVNAGIILKQCMSGHF